MNLRSVDLNLLVIFDALMAERHVTRAATRIAMSQPAMSNALSRLRHIFKDELFIRTAGRMEPTPRALELGASVQQILRQAERLMSTDLAFDPQKSDKQFTLRMSDLIGYLALPGITQQIRAQAPRISLNIVHLPPDETVKALEADELDIAMSMDLRHSKAILAAPLFEDRMCCVMDRQHPLTRGALTMARFLKFPHVRVSMSPTDIRFVDNVLADRGLHREVALNIPHWLLLPPTLLSTDLVAVVSGKLADQLVKDPRIAAKALPFDSKPFNWHMYWHRRYDKSPAHLWLRLLISTVCGHV
jgi:DNA-binding transcriptional LysR family regulator